MRSANPKVNYGTITEKGPLPNRLATKEIHHQKRSISKKLRKSTYLPSSDEKLYLSISPKLIQRLCQWNIEAEEPFLRTAHRHTITDRKAPTQHDTASLDTVKISSVHQTKKRRNEYQF
jgi:uncharacterized protein YprB with RNaseH-like and TPR domain